MVPSTTKQWTVEGPNGFDGLKWNDKAEIPALGDHDVLVNFHYASLNYRDLIISLVSTPPSLLPFQTPSSLMLFERVNIPSPLAYPEFPPRMAQVPSSPRADASHASKKAIESSPSSTNPISQATSQPPTAVPVSAVVSTALSVNTAPLTNQASSTCPQL